ncbi:MAG: redox-regulated ATPase YchF [Candidatus Niyogibacteria bacterium CG10_big_fil_rev_8_21_14_0_10_46_36]|uniref:Redox-regulated ATPase YchF n=1 Tax=Candidatus Niyogibacteria bacterium CG10_big_fil_rev_8_21_14_0_10_46_36 TaxID=1974726 RepID=A0A2H0TDS5_9BACT|nr:MAG: redox-regulated ATPase YchF [Candidatus Niyogibacteria bacterium CG10_big_fil_rev_8_21_14_0_10_46_36]
MLKIGIVGLPNVGKSTLFKALTKKQVDIANYPFATIDPNVGVVAVPDERLEALSMFSKSKKTVPASIEFFDIAGLVRGAHKGEGLGNQFLSNIKEVDAVIEVVRAFEDENILHVTGAVDPKDDIETIHTELILADLKIVEGALTRAEKLTRGDDKDAKLHHQMLKEMSVLLSNGIFASHASEEIREKIKDLNLLTAKTFILLLNTKEDAYTLPFSPEEYNFKNVVSLNLKLEEEIQDANDEEARSLSEIDSLIKAAYEALDLITFFTTGEDESRAWPIPRHSSAPRAGRAIHSDFEQKFIRAEVIGYKELLEAGSYAKAREKGLLRTEGKKYVVQDGDVIEFRV